MAAAKTGWAKSIETMMDNVEADEVVIAYVGALVIEIDSCRWADIKHDVIGMYDNSNAYWEMPASAITTWRLAPPNPKPEAGA